MGERTAISWTDATFNPWNGCQRVSPGCENCYAEALDGWLRGGKHWGPRAPRQFFGDAHWKKPLRWNETAALEGRRIRVFCASTADVFEDRPELDEHRARLWKLIADTPNLDWLLLTKRPENVARMLPAIGTLSTNGWLGVTAENDHYARLRLPLLLSYRDRFAKLFVSYEPALGPIDWFALLNNADRPDWIIFGDESGRGRRDAELAWARVTRDACAAFDVDFHFKQWCGADVDGVAGARDAKRKIHLPVLDGIRHDSIPEPTRECIDCGETLTKNDSALGFTTCDACAAIRRDIR